MSKSNEGQVKVVVEIVRLLSTFKNPDTEQKPPGLPTVTVLSPYTKQVKLLKQHLQNRADTFTVDSFQGRESDIIIFSSVRCNAEGDFGFLEDARRLNVMWTRAKLGLILVGSRTMLEKNELWKRAVESCKEVAVQLPAES